jgi:hypothetical protein
LHFLNREEVAIEPEVGRIGTAQGVQGVQEVLTPGAYPALHVPLMSLWEKTAKTTNMYYTWMQKTKVLTSSRTRMFSERR